MSTAEIAPNTKTLSEITQPTEAAHELSPGLDIAEPDVALGGLTQAIGKLENRKNRLIEKDEFYGALGSAAIKIAKGEKIDQLPKPGGFLQRRAVKKVAKHQEKAAGLVKQKDSLEKAFGSTTMSPYGHKRIRTALKRHAARKAAKEKFKSGQIDAVGYLKEKEAAKNEVVWQSHGKLNKARRKAKKINEPIGVLGNNPIVKAMRRNKLQKISNELGRLRGASNTDAEIANQARASEEENSTNHPVRNSEPAEAVEPHEIDANIDFEDKAREIHEAVQEEIKHRREIYSNFMVQEALDSTIAEEAQEMYQEEIEKEIGMPFDEAVQRGGAHKEVALGLRTALKDIRDGKISEVQQKPAEDPAPAQEIKPAIDTDLFMNPVKIMSLRKKIDGKVKKDKENFLKNNPGQKFNREQVWQQVKSDVLPGYLGISKEGLNNPDVVGANDLDELEYMLTMDWAELQKLADETKNNQKPSPDTVVKVRDTSYEDLQKRFPNA